MSCNSCAKSFSLLRKEKGCQGCGFSYCSKCLDNKIFLKKLNREAKVCAKCKCAADSSEVPNIQPPDAYYKRIGAMGTSTDSQAGKYVLNPSTDSKDQEIQQRLQKLKEGHKASTSRTTEAEIAERLKKIKGEMPTASDAEIQDRLVKLKGNHKVSFGIEKSKLLAPDLRTEQQQADDLMKQYLEQTKIDTQYNNEFDNVLSGIESRLMKLKGADGQPVAAENNEVKEDSENEEETVKKIIQKLKVEATLEEAEICPQSEDELPFCEICNEDATLRCVGCRYLFCKRCYLEHKDDDECNTYEPYKPPKRVPY